MQREDVLPTLKAREADLRARGVVQSGSLPCPARAEERPDSDVYLMVEIAPSSRVDLVFGGNCVVESQG